MFLFFFPFSDAVTERQFFFAAVNQVLQNGRENAERRVKDAVFERQTLAGRAVDAFFLGGCMAFTEHDVIVDQRDHGEAFHGLRVPELFRRAQDVVNLVGVAFAGDVFTEIRKYANAGDRVLLNRYKSGFIDFPCAHFFISGTDL